VVSIEPKELGRDELDAIRHASPHTKHAARDRHVAALLGHIAAMDDEWHRQSKLISRQGKLLTGVVNAIRGEPDETTLWSRHDAPELAQKAMAVVHAARPVLAIADRDTDIFNRLRDALDAMPRSDGSLTDPGAPLPGWETVARKAERGEALNPIEALIMRLTPGDDARAQDFRRMLRAALDYTASQPKVDER
jgi:hypothetical protein